MTFRIISSLFVDGLLHVCKCKVSVNEWNIKEKASFLTVMLCLSCKEEKKVRTVRKVQKVVAPKGPRVMGDNTVSRKIGWVGGIYTVEVKRRADKSLEKASDGTHDYYDNKISVRILRQNGSEFFSREFTKADFKAKVDDQYYKSGALLGIVFVRPEGTDLVFAASVGNPDKSSDEYVPLVLKISKLGTVTITQDEDLE